MERWRRPGAGEILWVLLLLDVVAFILASLSHSAEMRNHAPFLFSVFLVWRVSRGGWLSRLILIAGSGLSCADAVLSVARLWDLAVVGLAIVYASQVALLASLPVYGRTRRVPILVRAASWTEFARWPPSWLLPWGLFLGMVVTLAYLGNMHWGVAPGCQPATADACGALAMGYPLHWLSAYGGTPVIGKQALVRDCAQWVLACTAVLYAAWSWFTGPAGPD